MIVYKGHCVLGSTINDGIFQDVPKIVSRTTSTGIVEIHVQWNIKEGRLQVMRWACCILEYMTYRSPKYAQIR